MRPNSAAAALAGLATMLLLFVGGCNAPGEEYRSFPSPDGRFRIVVLRTGTQTATMPGQAGDSPGVVRLYDRNDKLLQEISIEMVQLVDHVDWQSDRVTIKLIADWKLPDHTVGAIIALLGETFGLAAKRHSILNRTLI